MLLNKKSVFFVVFVVLLIVIYAIIKPSSIFEVSLENLLEKQYLPWGISSMGLVKVPVEAPSSKKVNIAVMDSGVNFNHPDFENKIKDGYNALNPNKKPWDDNGHGTLVTGVIAAQNNSIGVVGVIPHANIYPVKVLDEFGEGEIADVVEGIEWCIENEINIINMSFSLNYDDQRLRDAIHKALNSGINIVASASNGRDQEVGYPASYNGVFSVVAVDEKLNIYEESSKGKIDFAAPGVEVISTGINNDYEKIEGNSIATPYITGLIAILLAETNEIITYQEIIDFLEDNVLDLGDRGIDSIYGYGFVKF